MYSHADVTEPDLNLSIIYKYSSWQASLGIPPQIQTNAKFQYPKNTTEPGLGSHWGYAISRNGSLWDMNKIVCNLCYWCWLIRGQMLFGNTSELKQINIEK